MRIRAWVWLGLVPLAGVVAAQQAAPPAAPAAAEAAVRDRVAGYAKAYNGRNAAALAAFFTEDATLEDESGDTARGKAAILDRFATGFAQPSKHALRTEVKSVRFITPDVAQVEGTATLSAENEASVVAQFVALFAREGNAWLIAELRDLPAPPEDVPPYERLKELEWMVGDWEDDSPDATVRSTVRWGDNRAYLVRSSTVQVGGEKASSNMMILGWDPQSGQLHSWIFDSDGGHGEATWTRASDNQWLIRAKGVESDGTARSATQWLTIVNKDAIKTSSVDRIVGDELAPDIDEVLLVRKPPAPGGAAPAATPATPGR